ncbi:MAG: sporulation integral membrane protein YtvI [Eubacteriales bacterium]
MSSQDNGANKKLLKYVRIALVILVVFVVGYIFFNYLFKWLLPFIIAYLIASIIQPPVSLLSKRTRMPRKLSTFIVLLFVFILLGLAATFIIQRAVYELNNIYQMLKDYTAGMPTVGEYMTKLSEWAEDIFKNIPFFKDTTFAQILEQASSTFSDALNKILTSIVNQIPNVITSIIKLVPTSLVFVILLIVSTFYISLDYRTINRFIMAQIPERAHNWLREIKEVFFSTIWKYLKAYSVIIFITYCELVIGFLIIGVDYAFTLSILIALVDVLPILGTGTILIPWGIITLLQGNMFAGMALLILYAVITVMRQIIEPKIVGQSIGLYPVLTLISMYLGFSLLGVFGMFLFPIVIIILKTLNETGKIRLWKTPEPEVLDIRQISSSDTDKKNKLK